MRSASEVVGGGEFDGPTREVSSPSRINIPNPHHQNLILSFLVITSYYYFSLVLKTIKIN
jgi:hypothetical protein